jgi:hypothetical protein
MGMFVPSELVEVIESMPAMLENCFSSGVATGRGHRNTVEFGC